MIFVLFPIICLAQEWDYSIEFKTYDKKVYLKSEEYPQVTTKREKVVICVSKASGIVKIVSASLNFEWIINNISSTTDSDGDKIFNLNQGKNCKVEIGKGSLFFSPFWYMIIRDKRNPNIHYLFNTCDNQGYGLFDLYGDLKSNRVIFGNTNASRQDSKRTSNLSNSNSTSTSANSSVKAVFHGTRVGKVYHIPEDSRDDYDLFFQCNVTVYNIKGQQVQLTAYVDGPTRGKGLYAPNGRHKTSEGNVAIGGVLNSRTDSDNTRWPQYTLTLPFSDLCLPDGTHTINVRWFAQAQGKFIGNSEFQTIHFTKQGKEITNFYVDGGEETSGF